MTSNKNDNELSCAQLCMAKLVKNGSIALTNREETTLLPFFQIKPTLKYTNVKVIHNRFRLYHPP